MFIFLGSDKTTYTNYIPKGVPGHVISGKMLEKLNAFYPFYQLVTDGDKVINASEDKEARISWEAEQAKAVQNNPKTIAISEIEKATTIAALKSAMLKYINAE